MKTKNTFDALYMLIILTIFIVLTSSNLVQEMTLNETYIFLISFALIVVGIKLILDRRYYKTKIEDTRESEYWNGRIK